MRAKDSLNGLSLQVGIGNLLPQGSSFWAANTGINDGPTHSAFEKVKIDVIKAHRERHAKPINRRCNLDQFAGLGRFAKRVGNHRALGKFPNRDST